LNNREPGFNPRLLSITPKKIAYNIFDPQKKSDCNLNTNKAE